MDYSGTVNLPRTSFKMRGDLLERQEGMLRHWQAQDIYNSILEDRRDARPFIIHDGPPYASGQIHVGIGMNKIVKDIIAKYYSMNDRRVPFIPGWDCHGLPIELEVLKDLGGDAKGISTRTLRDRCAKFALHYVREQKRQFQRLGIFADWNRPYLTMNPSYEAGVLTALLKMVEKGYVYHDSRPVPWCVHCQTSLAEAEIEYYMMPARSAWIRFEGGRELAKRFGAREDLPCSMLVWTTSSWSVPGSVAVAAHPDLTYAAFEHESAGTLCTTIILDALAPKAFEALGVSSHCRLGTVVGRNLDGYKVMHPLNGKWIPVILAEFIRGEAGSGLVHIVPAHGPEDSRVARKYELEETHVIDAEGRFSFSAGEFSGLELAEGERAILQALSENGALAALGAYDYPHCWRCDNPLITQSTAQWFVAVDHREALGDMTLRDKALLEVQVVNWLPPESQRRIAGMIESRPDWCISRQRTWGVPIPAFTCRTCGESLLLAEAVRHVRDLVGRHGSAVWFEKEAADLLPPSFICPQCGGADFDKESHILDVWFESGASWQAVVSTDHHLSFPADLYVEGSDQHRGWFQLSLLSAIVSRGRAPFNSVFTHGFVLNERQQRMARAHGDLVTLHDALEKFPADLIRLYFSCIDVTTDVPLSLETFRSVEPQYRTIRNTFRYLLGNLYDFTFREDAVHLDDLHPLDLWALCRLHKLISAVTEDYAAYRFHVAVKRIHDFCNDFLSRLYFDVLKDRLYCESPESSVRRSAQTVLHSILMGLVKLLAPVLPYTCDEVWALTPGQADCASVHLSRWPKTDEQLLNSKRSHEATETYERLLMLREATNVAIERLRRSGKIAANTEAIVSLYSRSGIEELLGAASLADLKDFLLVSEIVIASDAHTLKDVAGLPGVFIQATASPHPTCSRCRRREATYGSDSAHPALCVRCAAALRQKDHVQLTGSMVDLNPSVEMRPADFAAFLIARDIRKVAILYEGGQCRAYALHAPSQQVLPLKELEPLADYVNSSADFREHAALLFGLGEHTDVLFGIGIHHLKYGTPLGGTREFAYTRMREMLDNLLRLSWGMSVKNAVADLPHGGGKSIIDTCGWDLKVQREFRREIYRDFGQFNATLFGRYICAEDLGNTTADTREMLYACRHVMCLSQGVGGSGNPSRFTALAAWAAAKAGWKFLTGTSSFDGLTIALQGAGNVARNLVPLLIEADPGIRKIFIADHDPEQVQIIRNILLKKGKGGLLEVVSSKAPSDQSVAALSYIARADEEGRTYILYTPCDILIPAAVGNVISPQNLRYLQCRMIVPVANNVYSDNDVVAQAMMDRDIVDVVENNVNWGGALAAASELYGYDEENITDACLEAYNKTLALLEEARRQNLPPWFIVKERASDRIFNQNHPIVGEARRYKFIGDISRGFIEWVKERWLRNVMEIERDKFFSYSVSKSRGMID